MKKEKTWVSQEVNCPEVDGAKTFSVISDNKVAKVIVSEELLAEHPELKEAIIKQAKKEK